MNAVIILLLALGGMFYFAPQTFLDKNSKNKIVQMLWKYQKMIAAGCVVAAMYLYTQTTAPSRFLTEDVSSVSDTTRSPELSDEMFKND